MHIGFLALVGLSLLGWLATLFGRRHPWRALMGVSLVLALQLDSTVLRVALAIDEWRTGEARLIMPGLGDNPKRDAETRLEWRSSCTTSARDAETHNLTLRLLHRYVGPAARTWQGPIPDVAAASALLASRGEVLETRERFIDRYFVAIEAAGTVGGRPTFVPFRGAFDECTRGPAPRPPLRAAWLEERAIVLGCRDEVGLYAEVAPTWFESYTELMVPGARL